MSAPLLSVVTICRNHLAVLRATVASVQSQWFDGLEQVIVDGASTDGTPAWLGTLPADRVRFVSEPDRGISDAMNKGVALARGGWVAHLHAGDSYLPGALARVRDAIARDDADVLCGWIVKEEPAGEVVCRVAPERLEWDMAINHPAAFVRRDWFARAGGFDPALRNAMDYDFFLKARLAGARFAEIPAPLARMPGGGQSERSLWRTLRETHEVRRRRLPRGASRSPAWLLWLWLKGSARIALQRAGAGGFVRWWRRRVAYPPKG